MAEGAGQRVQQQRRSVSGMLEFENGYAGDQSGVRIIARDGGRRVLFRVERQIAIEGLGLRPAPASHSRPSWKTIWRRCGVAASTRTWTT